MNKIEKNRGLKPFFNDWVDNFFGRDDDFFSGMNLFNKHTPAVNILDNPKEYILELGVPGMKREDFTIEFDNGMLVLMAEKEEKKEEKEKRWTRREFNFINFKRTFMIPENVNIEKVEAKYEDGLLKVRLPKIAVKEPSIKKIEIKGA